MSGRPTRVPPLLLDAAIAVVLTVVAQVELHRPVDDGYQAGPLWLNLPLVLLMTAPVGFRRVAPVPTLAVMLGAFAVPSLFVAHTLFFWGGMVPIAIATYTVARHTDGVVARHAWLVGPAILLTGMVHESELRSPSNIFFGTGLYAAAWGAGRVLRRMARQSTDLAAALEQLADQQAAREEAAVQAERSRIALEMHDVVAHAVSLMVLQVGAARLGLEQAGRTAPAQLLAAEETGRQALAELRRSLGVLREDPGRGVPEPLPGLAAVEPLVEGFRAAGLEVSLDLQPVDGLPTSLQLSVYRVLQEALTNVLKHAGPVAVRASVRRDGDGIVVEVSNPLGRAFTERVPSGGHGLAGMRERVGLFGGSLHAGPSPDGFGLRAHLPIPTGSVIT